MRCASCRFVYLSPMPTAGTIDEAARLGQHRTEAGTLDVVGRFSERKVSGLRERLVDLWREASPPWATRRTGRSSGPSRWLDIGAGFGELLKAVQGLGGAGVEVAGIEPCEPKVREALSRGLPVNSRSLAEAGTGWDVISVINVLSHVPDVHAFFGTIAEMLAVGGEILIVTGNGADIERCDYPQVLSLPDHLVFAGEAHVVGILERAGLHVERIQRYTTTMPRNKLEERGEALLSRLLRRRIGYSGTGFRSLWIRARKPLPEQELS